MNPDLCGYLFIFSIAFVIYLDYKKVRKWKIVAISFLLCLAVVWCLRYHHPDQYERTFDQKINDQRLKQKDPMKRQHLRS